MKITDFKPGFKYQAWVGYEWVTVEYPKTGFSKSQLPEAIKTGIVRPIPSTNNQNS